MKKFVSAILILIICFSLCSCKELDEMRDKHAIHTADGIIYKDKLYKSVDDTAELNFLNYKTIHSTDKDVPVLLSEIFCINNYMNHDETIICRYSWQSSDRDTYYVIADKYPEYEDSIKNGINYTEFGFAYYDSRLGETVEYILSASEKQFMSDALSSVPDDINYVIDNEIKLFTQSDNRLFRKRSRYSIIFADARYFIGEYDENGYLLKVYDVPSQANNEYDMIFEKTRYASFFDFENGGNL